MSMALAPSRAEGAEPAASGALGASGALMGIPAPQAARCQQHPVDNTTPLRPQTNWLSADTHDALDHRR